MVNMFDGSSGEVAVLQACQASRMSFGQDLDMIGDREHGKVSREVINIDQDILVILDKEDDNKTLTSGNIYCRFLEQKFAAFIIK